MRYIYKPSREVCTEEISFDINGDVVTNIKFSRGCNGNLKAVSSLADGLTVEQIERKCGGIKCGARDTSCADQLVRAIRQAASEAGK